jgi:hypothetical protein
MASLTPLNPTQIYKKVIHRAAEFISNFNLKESCLDATLLSVRKCNPYEANVYMRGDGFIFSKDTEGVITAHEINFEKNAPFYLSYELSEERMNLYKDLNQSIEITEYKKYTNSSFERYDSCLLQWDAINWNYNAKNYDYIGIASDGLNSFLRGNRGEKIRVEEVLDNLFDFKTFKGDFVKRRVNVFLKEMNKKDYIHYDDISIACLYLGDEK